jgi:predicted DsbA family dithiol-disulfide isomerase
MRAARDAAGVDVPIVVRAWPLELVNGQPLSPPTVAEEIEDLRAQVASDLFAGFDAAAFPHTSIPAFGLASAAYERDATTGEAASFALRDALFEHGRDVADPAVLAALARELGLTLADAAQAREAVEHDWAEGRRRGVVGSPHFFADGHGEFCPALRITRMDERHLAITGDRERMRDFFERAFR